MRTRLPATLGGSRLPCAVLLLSVLVLVAAPPGGHSLHLPSARDNASDRSLLNMASDIARPLRTDSSLAVLGGDISQNKDSSHTIISKRLTLLLSDAPKSHLVQQKVLTAASDILEGHAKVEPLAGKTDSSVVFVAVFCSLVGTILAVLLVVLAFVVGREAYEASEWEKRLRDQLTQTEESAYTAYPRDDSPSNFPSVYSQFAFEEEGAGPNGVHYANNPEVPPYDHRPIAPVHHEHRMRRGRGILRRTRRHPKKVVRVREPPVHAEPSIGHRHTKYVVTGPAIPRSRRPYRY